MRRVSFHVLQTGLGITFLWIGILIFRDPEGWGGLLEPWAASLIPGSLSAAMLKTAILDIGIGVLLLAGFWTGIASFFAAVHLFIVILTIGLSDTTARDIGLLAATTVLLLESPVPGRLSRLLLRT